MNRRAFLSTVIASTSVLIGNSRGADDSAPCLPTNRNDELWVIGSRRFGCNESNDHNRDVWQVCRRESVNSWRSAEFNDYTQAASDSLPTVVYVHGNRNDWNWALRNGQTVYQALVRNLSPDTRFRFVIYAWPSDQIRGPVKDARYKADVANQEAYRFAWLLAHTSPATQLGLIGFSLGGRIITGGMHLLAGGQWQGHSVPKSDRPATRAVLWAPALHDYWLLPGSAHGQALQSLDRLRLYYNSCDPVLKHYPLAEQCGKPAALGYSGCRSLTSFGEATTQVIQSDVRGQVGKTHEMSAYCGSECIMRETRNCLLWQS